MLPNSKLSDALSLGDELLQEEDDFSFAEDSLPAFIMENSHLLDAQDAEDPTDSYRDGEDMPPPEEGLEVAGEAGAPDYERVRESLLEKAQRKYDHSVEFQKRHRDI